MPPKLTPPVVQQVLERMAQGQTIRSIAADLGFHPSAWRQLVEKDPSIRVAHDQAKVDGCATMVEECLAIADARPGNVVTMDAEGNVTGKRIDAAYVAWAKNRIETRLKLLATWMPEKYGAKAQQGDTNVTVNIATHDQVARIGKELRLLRRDAKAIEANSADDLL